MKLAFTTLGCPKWDLDTIISKAVEFGYAGVDFRGYLGEMEIYKLPEFKEQLSETKEKFAAANLEIPCFSSSVRLFITDPDELTKNLVELEQYAKLCLEFNTSYIRVFGGDIGNVSREDAIKIVVDNLKQMLSIAEKYQVTILLETHDAWTSCEHVNEVVRQVDSEYFKVLWDIHHPYRTEGEDPNLTWNTLGDRIQYTHWKDSYIKAGTARGYQLCLLGEGDVPLKRIYQLLKNNNYTGYFTLEWEKLWCPEIEEPEVAFRQYSIFMKQLMV